MFCFIKKILLYCSTFFKFIHNYIFLKSLSLIWESAYIMQCFSVLYSDALVSSFFLILYNYESHLSRSVLLSLFTRWIFCFQLANIDTGLCCVFWFLISWFNLFHALYMFCLARISCFCISKSLSYRLYTLSNFLFNQTIFFSISSDWILAIFIEFSILAWSFFISNFSQLVFFLSCVTFTYRLAFLSSRLKGWLVFLMKEFVSFFHPFVNLLFQFSAYLVISTFLPFGIALSWAFSFIGTLGVLLSLVSLWFQNEFFYTTNELVCNQIFLAGFNTMTWYCKSISRFWLMTINGQKRFQDFKILLKNF